MTKLPAHQGASNNVGPTGAKMRKNNEYYTPLSVIQNELVHYDKKQFKGKIVYCNCDDYRTSNFVSYFKTNFHELGLKELIATHYVPFDMFSSEVANKYTYNGLQEVVSPLSGDGDFRSEECLSILKASDIIVTNPPFSIFKQHIDTIMTNNKLFLTIGNVMAVRLDGVFEYIKCDRIRIGFNYNYKVRFIVPDDAVRYEGFNEDGSKYSKACSINWFTNLTLTDLKPERIYPKTYHPDIYPFFDGTNIISVPGYEWTPNDYPGLMGVPITILNNFSHDDIEVFYIYQPQLNGVNLYDRVVMRWKKPIKVSHAQFSGRVFTQSIFDCE